MIKTYILNQLLVSAAKRNSISQVKKLIGLGAKPQDAKYNFHGTKISLIHYLNNQLLVKKRPSRVIEYFIENRLIDIDTYDNYGSNLFLNECRKVDFDKKFIELLIQNGCLKNNKNITAALYYFAMNNNKEMVERFMNLKGNPLPEKSDWNCIDVVFLNGNLNLLEIFKPYFKKYYNQKSQKVIPKNLHLSLLVCNSLGNSLKSYGFSPTKENRKKYNERLKLLEYLIQNFEKNINNIVYPYPGVNPLLVASNNRFHSGVKKLIEYGANVNVQDTLGDTPLILATKNNDLEMVEILVQNGADVTQSNYVTLKPKYYSEQLDNKNIMNFLIQNGA